MSSTTASSSGSRYDKRRRLLIARGQWNPNADAAPVRAHVRELKKTLSRDQIAELAGVSKDTVTRLLYTDSKLVRSPTATALMRVKPGTPPLSRGALVSSVRTCETLRSLTADGWGVKLLAGELEMWDSAVRRIRNGKRKTVRAGTEAAVVALSKRLAGQGPPEWTKAQRFRAAQARDLARLRGWAPSAAPRGNGDGEAAR